MSDLRTATFPLRKNGGFTIEPNRINQIAEFSREKDRETEFCDCGAKAIYMAPRNKQLKGFCRKCWGK